MTKERLRNYQTIKREREQLQAQLDELEAALYYPKAQRLTGMPHSPSKGNATEDMAARHLELLEKYNRKVAELASEQLEIEKAIDSLDPTARMLLRYRYLDGLKWEEICCKLSYSWRQTHRVHAQALEQLRGADD